MDPNVNDWPTKHEAIHAMLDALPGVLGYVTRPLPDHDIAVGAALARCRRLLVGLDRAFHAGDEEDLAGLFIRPLFETWLTGFYMLFEGPAAWETLKSEARRQIEVTVRLARLDVPAAAGWTDETKGPSVVDVARRVSAGFKDRGEPAADFPVDSYELMYRHASLRHAHGGAGPLTGHVDPGPPCRVLVVRNEGHESGSLVLWGGMLVSILADSFLGHLNLPVLRRRLDDITKPLEEARDPATWRYTPEELDPEGLTDGA